MFIGLETELGLQHQVGDPFALEDDVRRKGREDKVGGDGCEGRDLT